MISFMSDSVAFIFAMRKMYLMKGSTNNFCTGIKFKNFKQVPITASAFFSLAEVDHYAFLLKIFSFTVCGKLKIEQIKNQ